MVLEMLCSSFAASLMRRSCALAGSQTETLELGSATRVEPVGRPGGRFISSNSDHSERSAT